MKIEMPSELGRSAGLRAKLGEYQKRIDRFLAPELQIHTICKIAVLEAILTDGSVDTEVLREQMRAMYGSGFSEWEYNDACAVIP